MATLQHPLGVLRRGGLRVGAPAVTGGTRPAWRSGRGRPRRALLVLALAAAVLGAGLPSAAAAPGDDGGTATAQSTFDALAAEVERITGLVEAAEQELQRLTVEAEAAADSARAAQDGLAAAQAAAAAAAADLEVARSAVAQAQGAVTALAREAFMGSAGLGDAAALLDSAGPDQFLQRAATMDLLGDDRAARLAAFEALRAQQQAADRAARAAVATQEQAAAAAAQADAAARAQMAAAQQSYDTVAEQQATLRAQLRDAEIQLLAAQGVQQAAATYDQQQRAEIAQERAATAALVAGRVTSCYGSRSGTQHNGIDIAATLGTPIYVPADGVVVQAGPANGFGLAVYIQHADGTITLYGHINRFFVSAGQRVTAGQQIAEVGNRGQSTGPHLHIETHTGGLYVNRVDPAPWLAARGITLGGACG
ncbi:M23 family metallopeptidase [Geodermatophilus sp. FMUSA9-8]|uniref:M23 family metallopeptidase n=1 Tax=Geodermatophilus sp. FMUSA9-8 TaxID=3120155 RepID=UPI0030089AD6